MNKQILGKILMILLLVFVLVLGTVIVLEIQNNKAETTSEVPTEGTPTPTFLPAKPVSKWATDSAIIKAENNLKELNQILKSTDLKESSLIPPVLDMEVKF